MHASGVCSVLALMFAFLVVPSLSNMVRRARTANDYRPATFNVEEISLERTGDRRSMTACYASGRIGAQLEKLSLHDCTRGSNGVQTADAAVGQTIPVLFNPDMTQTMLQGEYLRVVWPKALEHPWEPVGRLAPFAYRPFAVTGLALIFFAGCLRLTCGPGSLGRGLWYFGGWVPMLPFSSSGLIFQLVLDQPGVANSSDLAVLRRFVPRGSTSI